MSLMLILVYAIGFVGFSMFGALAYNDESQTILQAMVWPLVVVCWIVCLPYRLTYRLNTGEWP